jgi:hypothetical protein
VAWVTRIWSPTDDESDLLDALRHGRVFFADPSQYRGDLDVFAPIATTAASSGPASAQMGDVLVVPSGVQPPSIAARVSGVEPGDLVTWYCDGSLVHADLVQDATTYDGHWQPPALTGRLLPVRLQVHRPHLAGSAFDAIIACSNPIYLAAQPPETGHRVRSFRA